MHTNSRLKVRTFPLAIQRICFLAVVLIFTGLPSNAYRPKLVIEKGHTSDVSAVVFSPDGAILASGSGDRTIKLWHVPTRKEVRTFTTSGLVTALAISPDGKTLAAGSDDKTIKFFNLAMGTRTRSVLGHSELVSSLAFSPDGKVLVSGSYDKTIKLWNVDTGKHFCTLIGHADSVCSVSISPNGTIIASGGADGIKFWNMRTGKQLQTRVRWQHLVNSIAFSPDGKKLAAGGDAGTMLWNMVSGQQLPLLSAYSRDVESVAFSQQGTFLAAGTGDDKTIRLWNLLTGKMECIFGHSDSVSSLAFNPLGGILASGSFDYTVRLWKVETGKPICILGGNKGSMIHSVAVSSDGKTLASACGDKTIKLWDLPTGRFSVLTGHSDEVVSIAFSPNGKFLASGAADKIKLWDFSTRKVIHDFSVKDVRSLLFSADSATLASVTNSGTTNLWSTATGEELKTPVKLPTMAIAISPNGRILASCDEHRKVMFWDLVGNKLLFTLPGESESSEPMPVFSITFSPDGKNLALALNKTIRVWDLETKTEKCVLVVPKSESSDLKELNTIFSIAFSPDGYTIASGHADQTVRLWDLSRGTHRTLSGHSNAVMSVEFFSKGNYLASGSWDNTTKLWEASSGREIASLCAFGENDWAIVTSEGRFDANDGGMQMLHYNVANEVVELGRFKQYFYEPGLLSKLLGFSDEPLYKIPSFDNIKLPPVVSYKLMPDSDKLILTLKNSGGGFGRVEVKVDKALLELDSACIAATKGADSKAEIALPVDLSKALNVKSGESPNVTVNAYSADGLLVSRDVRVLAWKPTRASASSTPPEIYVISAGVSEYANSSLNLKYSAKDARDFAKAVEVSAKAAFGPDRVHMFLLASGAESQSLPTRDNIRKAFREVIEKAKPDDIVIIYLSGHGVSVPIPADNGGQNHLYCYLTKDARMTDFSSKEMRDQTTISSEDLREWMKANVMRAKKRVLILDTCAAGSVVENLALTRNSTGDQQKAVAELKDKVGFHVLMGCTEDAVSYEAGEFGQGLLTYAILNGMTGQALSRDGVNQRVWVNELFNYAIAEVPKLASGIGGIQQPRFMTPSNSTNFWIGQVGENEIAQIPIASRKPRLVKPVLFNNSDMSDNELTVLLRTKLNEEFSTQVRGASGRKQFIYIAADECPGACSPRGRYTVDGDKVVVDLEISKDKKKIGKPIHIEASKTEIIPLLQQAILDEIAKAE